VKSIFLLICILIFPTTCFSDASKIADGDYPFRPGEKLTYELFWEVIPAGTAVLEVRPMETVDGTRAYHFAFTVKSTPFIDNFYKVRDFVDAYVDTSMTHSILYRQKQQEGKHKRDIAVTFDWIKAQTQYENFGKKTKPIPILPGTFDPLSVFYAFRLRQLGENMTFEIPVSDGKKCTIGKARILERQTIKVASGEYDTFLVEPDMKDVGGVFNKSKDAKLHVWVTSDENHIPVKITSKVVVGRFVAELVSIEKN
jgi:hypothetical protein